MGSLVIILFILIAVVLLSLAPTDRDQNYDEYRRVEYPNECPPDQERERSRRRYIEMIRFRRP